MHLIIEAVGTKSYGGAAVLHDFLSAAIDNERITKITLFCSPAKARNFSLPKSSKLVEQPNSRADHHRFYRLWWLEHGLRREAARIGGDVVLCFNGAGIAPPSMPQVTLIQQALPYSREALRQVSMAQRTRMLLIRVMARRACHASKKVLVQTPTMSQWVRQAFKISTLQIVVIIPHGGVLPTTTLASRIHNELNVDEGGVRLLYVGNDSGYKNLRILAPAMNRLRESITDAKLHITLPGNHPLCLSPGIVGLGYLSRSQLRAAYDSATALVMPSLVETVGLPMLEAMSVGLPVLAADRPYAHDICESSALYFDPLQPDDLASKAKWLVLNKAERDVLVEQGRNLTARRLDSRPYHRMVDEVVNLM